MENSEILQTYRDQIDTIDSEVIYLLSRRFEIVKQIWILKKELDMAPLQPERWQEVLNNLKEDAKEHWVNENLIEDIWNRIHKESLNLEK
jgi:chorismate mutase